jgi:hypothetical protein
MQRRLQNEARQKSLMRLINIGAEEPILRAVVQFLSARRHSPSPVFKMSVKAFFKDPDSLLFKNASSDMSSLYFYCFSECCAAILLVCAAY